MPDQGQPNDPIALGNTLQPFADGDYAGVLRETKNVIGTYTVLELAWIRMLALRRLRQDQTADALGRSLAWSMPDTPDGQFHRALTRLLLGEVPGDEVLRMAKSDKQRCQALYYSAARTRTEDGFEAARPGLEQCARTAAATCLESELARMELAAAESSVAAARAAPQWLPGDVIERTYRVRSINTTGAMAIVYFAWHETWNVELALKVPRTEVLSGPAAWDRLTAEANTWVSLGMHPNIVAAYYVRRIHGVPVIVMEKVDGGNLEEALASGRIADLGSALDVAIQIAGAAAYAGEKRPGFVHRDIKPANVLLTSGGCAKLSDFGLTNSAGRVAGTPAYMAPEVWARADTVKSAADVYSIGVILFEMLTGRLPFGNKAGGRFTRIPDSLTPESGAPEAIDPNRPGATAIWSGDATLIGPAETGGLPELMRAHLHELPPEPHQLRSEIPIELSRFCLELLAKDPSIRPSASEVVAKLIGFFKGVTGREYPRPVARAPELLADSLNNHALSMLDLGCEEEAMGLWKQALQANPLEITIVFNAGVHAWRQGELTDLELLERLADAAPSCVDPPSASYLTALVHLERGDGPAALTQLNGVDGSFVADKSAIESAVRRAHEQVAATGPLFTTMDGHTEAITAVRLSQDGSRALTAARDHTLKAWTFGNGVSSTTIGQHAAPVTAADVAEDWSVAASIDAEGVLHCWDLKTGAKRQSIQTGQRHFGLVVISGDGRICLTGAPAFSGQAYSCVWDAETGRRTATLGGGQATNSLFLSSERDLAIATDWTSMRFWRLSTGELFHVIDEFPRCPLFTRPIGFDRQGGLFVVSHENVNVLLVETRTGRVARTFRGHKDAVLQLACPAELDRFVSSGADATVRLWDVQSGRCLRSIDMKADRAAALAVSADGRRVIVGTEAGRVAVFDWPNGSFSAPFVLSRPLGTDRMLQIAETVQEALRRNQAALDEGMPGAAAEAIRRARDLPGCRRHTRLLAAWFESYGRLGKRSLADAWKTRSLQGHKTFVQSVRLSGNEDRLLTGGRDGLVLIYAPATGECLHVLQANPDIPPERPNNSGPDLALLEKQLKARLTWSADLSPDGRLAAAAGGDGRLRLWDASSGELLRAIVVGDVPVLAVRFTWKSDRVVAGSADGALSVFDVNTGQRQHALAGHSDAITALAITPDDRHLVTTGEDQTIRLWSLDQGESLRTFGADLSGPLVTANAYFERQMHAGPNPSVVGIRALIKSRTDHLHLPVRLGAQRALAVCIDRTAALVLRAIGTRVELWNVGDSSLVRSIEAHPGLVLAADMTSDARFAVSAGIDRRICVWDLTTGACLRSMHVDEEPWSVCLSRDGRNLFSGEFGAVTQWTLDWELTEDGQPAETPQPGERVEPRPNPSLVSWIDDFIASRNEALEQQLGRIASAPPEQLLSARPILVDRLPSLIERLRSADGEWVSQIASYLLFRTGEAAIPALVALLGDPKQGSACAAGLTLFSIGPQSIPFLCDELRNKDLNARLGALATLGVFGPMARSAVPEIARAAAETDDPTFHEAAVKVMKGILNPDHPGPDTHVRPPRRPSHRRLGQLALLTLLIGAIWWGLARLSDHNARQEARWQERHTAEENIRQARSIIGMWSSGVSAEHLPNLSLSTAEKLLRDAISATADDSIRRDAGELRRSLDARPHFAKLAGSLRQFAPLFPALRELLVGIDAAEIRKMPVAESGAAVKSLVVTVRQHPSTGPTAQDDPLFFDAELNDALGASLALSSPELKSLIALYFDRTEIGTHQFELPNAGFAKTGLPTQYTIPIHSHSCRVLVIDVASRSLRSAREFVVADPKEPSARFPMHTSGPNDAYHKLRKEVREYIVRLSSSAR